jgi:hypothetical protein
MDASYNSLQAYDITNIIKMIKKKNMNVKLRNEGFFLKL